MSPTTKRISLIIAGALISGAALMAQGAASPTTKAVAPKITTSSVKGQAKSSVKGTKKATRRVHRHGRKASKKVAPKANTTPAAK